MKYTFSNDVTEVFPRSSRRAISTNWTTIKPPDTHEGHEIEIKSLYSVPLYMQEEGEMREESKKGKGHKKGKEREERRWHLKGMKSLSEMKSL